MIIKVKVKPNSLKERIEKFGENEYKIDVKEPAENNKANMRVVNLISKELNVSYRDIKIKNPNSREKIIEIAD